MEEDTQATFTESANNGKRINPKNLNSEDKNEYEYGEEVKTEYNINTDYIGVTLPSLKNHTDHQFESIEVVNQGGKMLPLASSYFPHVSVGLGLMGLLIKFPPTQQ